MLIKSKIFMSITLITTFFISQQSRAYAYDLDVVQKNDKSQTIIFLSDRHQKYTENTTQQKALVEQVSRTNGAVIIEDFFCYDRTNPIILNYIEEQLKNDTLRFLDNFTHILNQAAIKTTSIEFRQEKILSLYGYDIPAQQAINHYTHIIKEIETYNDGPLFNAYYKKILIELRQKITTPCKRLFKKLFQSQKNIKELLADLRPTKNHENALCYTLQCTTSYVKELVPEEQLKMLTLLFDNRLIDARIIHAIAQHQNKSPLYICAGGNHIKRVVYQLTQSGYTVVDHIAGTIKLDEENIPAALNVEEAFSQVAHHLPPLPTKKKNIILILIVIMLISMMLLALYKLLKKYNTMVLPTIAALCISQATSAHIFQAHAWTKDNHTIVTLGDYHESEQPENQINHHQKADIMAQAKKEHATIIVEDIFPHHPTLFKNPYTYDPNDAHEFPEKISTDLENDPIVPPIFGLVPCCRQKKINIINIEFRHANNASGNNKPVSARASFLVSQKIRDIICSYNDNDILNAHYKETVAAYDCCLKKSKIFFDRFCRNSKDTIQKILKKMRRNKGVNDVLRYLEWDTESIEQTCYKEKNEYAINFYDLTLIDMQILHQIYLNTDKPLLICAGSLHIRNIEPILEKMGYTCVARYGPDNAYDPKKGEPDALHLAQIFSSLGILFPQKTDTIPFGIYLCCLSLFFIISVQRIRKKKTIKSLN